MVMEAKIEYRLNPLRQGSRNRRGDQVDQDFVHDLLDLLGDVRALWLPGKSGTTLTDRSRKARVLTWSEEVSAFDTKPAELGSGYAITFNGSDEEGDTPDADDLSFGDGAVDQPFSIVALVNVDDITSARNILAKWDSTTGAETREWELELDGSGRPMFRLYDESANAQIARYDATALTTGQWKLVVGTYDGSGASTGLRVYLNASRVDDTDSNSGTYTAMENTTQEVTLAFLVGAASNTNFFDGKMALVGLVAKELSQDEVWALKEAASGYFGLSL